MSDRNYIVVYHKSESETIKMTKRSAYLGARRSKRNFEKIGIKPCEACKKRQKKLNDLFPYK